MFGFVDLRDHGLSNLPRTSTGYSALVYGLKTANWTMLDRVSWHILLSVATCEGNRTHTDAPRY